MYQALKNNIVQYILDYEPTPEQLDSLNCDSYELYTEPEPSQEEVKSQLKQQLIQSEDISTVDISGVTFSDTEIGDIILQRVFGGNPHAESALQSKVSSYLLSVISGDENEEILEEISLKKSQVNEVRNKFGLTSI